MEDLTVAAKRNPKPSKTNAAKQRPELKLGDRVEIRHSEGLRGRIVELRGPLGPQGAQVYRVLVRRKPKSNYIELLGDQLVLIATQP
jgi:hypothetical protein